MLKTKALQKPLMPSTLLCLLPMGVLAQSMVMGPVSNISGEPVDGA